METWHGLPELPNEPGRHAVAIGTFDGVHLGHRAVIGAALARRTVPPALEGVRAAVLTFHPHPMTVVRPDAAPPALATLDRRLALLAAQGVDATLVVAFTRDLASLAPEAFVEQYLVGGLRAAAVVVGAGFRFGHKASGDVALLRRTGEAHGFDVHEVAIVGEPAGQTADGVVSSTRIRAAIAAGDVETAWRLLGRPHLVEGVVVMGEQRGRELGYPTANIADPVGIAVPPDGVYAGWLTRADSNRMPAAISVGTNPTFGEHSRRVEAYVLDRTDLDLYGEHVAIELGWHLRGMITFSGVGPLLVQMADDVERTRDLTGSA